MTFMRSVFRLTSTRIARSLPARRPLSRGVLAVAPALVALASGCASAPPPRLRIAEVPIRTQEEMDNTPFEPAPIRANKFACVVPDPDPMACAARNQVVYQVPPMRSGIFIGGRGRLSSMLQ